MTPHRIIAAVVTAIAVLGIGNAVATSVDHERLHRQMAAYNHCLDTNTAALPAVQAMCEARAAEVK